MKPPRVNPSSAQIGGARHVLLSIPFFARRDDFVGQVGNLRPIGNRPALWGGQSWLQPAFSRLFPPLRALVSNASDVPEGIDFTPTNAPPAPLLTDPSKHL